MLFQDSAVVPGLIDTIDTVMSHITYNLQASKPQVAIVGSSSMAGSSAVGVWVRLAVRQARAGGSSRCRQCHLLVEFCRTPAFSSVCPGTHKPHMPSVEMLLFIVLNYIV
mgnify:CR=1 FL=1